MKGVDPGVGFLVGLRVGVDVSLPYLARLAEEVDAGEDAQHAQHALEPEAAAHEQDEQELPQPARYTLEH